MLSFRSLAPCALLALAASFACKPPNDSGPPKSGTAETVVRTDYTAPAEDPKDVLSDDRLEDKKPHFDAELVDRRPLQGWLVNLSDSVLKLDVPLVKPDVEPGLLTLRASYADAIAEARKLGQPPLLLSVNLVDGKAKQFDDGLYAALDQAYYQGVDKVLTGHVALVRRLYDKLGPDSPAAPYLAAGLELARVDVEPTDTPGKEERLKAFQANAVFAKPIGFYTWNETLSDCFRFLRYFSRPFGPKDGPVVAELVKALRSDKALLADYGRALAFYARLTNPLVRRSVADVAATPDGPIPPAPVLAFFPGSTSRESELFFKLFPNGIPPDVDLMKEFVRRIKSGEVSLSPKAGSGWYDYQVSALETLLLPEKGAEHEHLLLTKAYKKRMLEAFKALVTKRRETHVRQLDFPAPTAAPPPPPSVTVAPRLRIEPNPTYYLRTARAYAFLATLLDAMVGEDTLKWLHGLADGGRRPMDLHDELAWQRDLFYGLHYLSAEDLGLKPETRPDEPAERSRCEEVATAWLAKAIDDPDLKADTRVAVPIYYDGPRDVTRLWMTIGVRLTRLSASYERPPRIKPETAPGDWIPVAPSQLRGAEYLIPVDEFAEVEVKGGRVFTRAELRALCDRLKTKQAIVEAIQR
ncbi:MAG: hypothetical protein P4L84_03735 [Isosphaeraceae bacterium]|nr:hypothetical protein [Isosphaeraceae bacterium]